MEHPPLKTFIIYARDDGHFKSALRRQLTPMEQLGLLEVWDDSHLLPGEEWEKSIEQKLDESDLVLMLVSAASLFSDFIQKKELKTTLERKQQGVTQFVPILVRDCLWDLLPDFKNVQMLPLDPQRSLLAVEAWLSQSSAWAAALRELHRLIPGIQQKIAAEKNAREAALAAEQDAQRRKAEAERAENLRHNRDEAAWKKTLAAVAAADHPEDKIEIYQTYLEDHHNHRDEAETALHTLEGEISLARKLKEKAEQKRLAAEAEAQRKAEELEARAKNLPEMIRIEGGTFQMGNNGGYGDEKPAHTVTVKDFYLGKYPVTFEEYDRFCTETKREKPADQGWGRGRRPVINISWKDAKAYCEWLFKTTGQSYRLPSEAEWEYAARGGQLSKGFTYSGSNQLDEVGWCWENSGDNKLSGEWKSEKVSANNCKTHPVGEKKPNELGLYDMSGNVWEWCEDDWHGSYNDNPPTDGSAWVDTPRGSNRARRGGSWGSTPASTRVANRSYDLPAYRYSSVGFRLARTP